MTAFIVPYTIVRLSPALQTTMMSLKGFSQGFPSLNDFVFDAFFYNLTL